MVLKIGDMALDFSVKDTDDKLISLKDFRGKFVVLYFYPKDNTPGCTKEACSFRDNFSKFKDVIVLGVSKDSSSSHKKFIDKFNLPFKLLVDDGDLCEKYGVYGEKIMYGRKYLGIFRKTFLIDKNSKIKYIFDKPNVDIHAKEVLEVLKNG